MKHAFLFFFLLVTGITGVAQVNVEDFREKPGLNTDWHVIQAALCYVDSLGHGTVEFEGTRTYKIKKPLELPRYSKKGTRTIILNGNGCVIETKKSDISIFRRIPEDQSEALNKMMSTRFVINDFTLRGGAKGIDLGATFGSSINRCTFIDQKQAGVDIQFGLQTEINHCMVNNCFKDGFVLRCGKDWGGGVNNSQSNHSVIQSCRVYSRKENKGVSFRVLGTSGVVLRDIISEGHHNQWCIYVDYQGSTTVRLFKMENLHLENNPMKGAIYLRSTGISTLDGIFYQKARNEWPLVYVPGGIGQVSLINVPHFVGGTILKHDTDAAWLLKYVNGKFLSPDNWRTKEGGEYKKKRPRYFYGHGFKYGIRTTIPN